MTRAEKVTLRLAVTVVEELPNGVLRIAGQQQVRVNTELRDYEPMAWDFVMGFARDNALQVVPLSQAPGAQE